MSVDSELIRKTQSIVLSHSKGLATTFYQMLEDTYPESKILFQSAKMNVQKMEFERAFYHILSLLDQPEELQKYLHDIGIRHMTYGILAIHYPMITQTLILTLKSLFAEQWNGDIEKNWKDLIQTILKQMLNGVHSVDKNYNNPPVTP